MINSTFPTLFKRYRLRSEIETLAEFGDLLAQEGIIYENSIFTRWQKGDRVPNERKAILKIISIFIKREGITTLSEANSILESLGMSYLTEIEIKNLPQIETSSHKLLQASLGGLIKDYRTQKNISQLEIAFALGQKDGKFIDDIEQGRVEKPDRIFLENLMEAMNLEIEEKNELLLSGGYLPNEKEIIKIRQEMGIINSWPYSSMLFDFSWRIIHFNKAAIKLYGIKPEVEKYIKNKHPNLVDVVFDPNLLQNSLSGNDKKKWNEFLINFLLRFRYAQRARSKEDWYLNLIKRLMNNELFRDIWMKTQNSKSLNIYNFGSVTPIIHPRYNNKRLSVYFSMVPLLKDHRFELELDTPGDRDTYDYFERAR